MSLPVDALFFDLDGTLLDTLNDLADAVNAVLAARGFPTHPVPAYRLFVGNGVQTLMARAAPGNTEATTLRELVEEMRKEYGKNWFAKTRPYEGVVPMLRELERRGLPLAVLSNKPHEFTELTVRHFFPDIPFARVQGSPKGGRAKPDPTLALSLAQALGVLPERVLFMGDSRVDMDTATAAGMIAAGALWGFRSEEELVKHGARILLRKPEDVFAYL